ncbi:MAG: M15 family metallopeptidase [Bacteroidota bacterium]
MYIRGLELIKRTFWCQILIICFWAWACSEETTTEAGDQAANGDPVEIPALDSSAIPFSELELDEGRDTSQLERTLIEQGLVNLVDLSDQFIVRMMYSTDDNFLNEDVYGDYDLCYLQPEVAAKLVKADSLLQSQHPDLRLIVFDCVRPRSVQYQMWEIVKGTDQQNYVAPPGGSGSMHNYGAAVDLGLYHVDTGIVDMGTPFDFFGPLAQPRFEIQFLRSGKLSQAQINHRAMLRIAMKGAGFQGILSEWWHFIGFDRSVVRKKYQIVE